MHHGTRLLFVPILPFDLFSAKPLSELIMLMLAYSELAIGDIFQQFLLSKIQELSFQKINFKILSAEWQPFCLVPSMTDFSTEARVTMTLSWLQGDNLQPDPVTMSDKMSYRKISQSLKAERLLV